MEWRLGRLEFLSYGDIEFWVIVNAQSITLKRQFFRQILFNFSIRFYIIALQVFIDCILLLVLNNRNRMNIIQFMREPPNGAASRVHFRAAGEREGVVCKKCGCKKHWWLKNKD
jgi:hypothetical protein